MNKKTIILNNTSTENDALTKFIRNYIHTENIPENIFDDLRLACEEIFINIINHAHSLDETEKITVEIRHSEKSLIASFIDTGPTFNPLVDCTSDTTTNDPCEGGMGIHLIKSLTDQQEYNRIDKCNVFTITKHYTIK